MTESSALTDAVADVVDWIFDDAVLGADHEITPEVEQSVRRLFLDTLGCVIGGAQKPELRTLNSMLATTDGGAIDLPGMAEPLTVSGAVYWSAMAATWDEACEGLARAHGRPGLHSFPVALALTLASNGSLGDALRALIRGYEIAGRLGEHLRIKAGMHVDGTWGTFGAVTASGSVLGHTPEMVMATIEAAACQTPMSLYLPVAQGATIRNSYVAEACRRAIGLSVSVAAGVTTPHGGLESFEALALDLDTTAPAPPPAIAPPGEWLITQGYLKPYAAVRHVHYGAEAALRWHRQGRPATTIDALTLEVYPEAVTYCGNRAPQTAIEAQFSLTYGIAHMLHTGGLGPEAYTPASLADPEIARLERMIRVTAVPGATSDQRYATLQVGAADRAEQTIEIDRVDGDASHPLSTDDVVAKFIDYSEWLPAGWHADAVVAAVLDGPLDAGLADVISGTSV